MYFYSKHICFQVQKRAVFPCSRPSAYYIFLAVIHILTPTLVTHLPSQMQLMEHQKPQPTGWRSESMPKKKSSLLSWSCLGKLPSHFHVALVLTFTSQLGPNWGGKWKRSLLWAWKGTFGYQRVLWWHGGLDCKFRERIAWWEVLALWWRGIGFVNSNRGWFNDIEMIGYWGIGTNGVKSRTLQRSSCVLLNACLILQKNLAETAPNRIGSFKTVHRIAFAWSHLSRRWFNSPSDRKTRKCTRGRSFVDLKPLPSLCISSTWVPRTA